MMTQRTELDVLPGGIAPVIHVSQYDTGSRTLIFDLIASTGDLILPSGTHAEIRGTKPDGNGFSYECEIGGKTVTADLTEQMTAAAGKAVCEIVLYTGTPAREDSPASNDFTQLCTANFILFIERAALDKDTLKSGSEIRQLINVIDHTPELLAAAASMEEAKEAVQEMTDSTREDMAQLARNIDERAQEYADQSARSAASAAQSATSAEHTLETVQEKGEQISRIALTSDTIARQALEKAMNAENESAETSTFLEMVRQQYSQISLAMQEKVDGAYVEDGYLVLTSGGDAVTERLGPFSGTGGGSGGGSSGNNAHLTLTNTSGFLQKTIAHGDRCPLSIHWESLEDGLSTGNGTMKITVGGVMKAMMDVRQGAVTVDVSPYVSAGTSIVKITVSDVYGNNRTLNFTITSVQLTLTSSFDDSVAYTGPISFPYVPTGNIQKTVHFLLDGYEISNTVTSVSGRQQSFTIPPQSHGAHTFICYFDAEINGALVRSNELYYEIISLETLHLEPIVTCDFHEDTVKQYSTIHIGFSVYDPTSMNAEVVIQLNGITISSQTVGRGKQDYAVRLDEIGSHTFRIASGEVSRSFTLTVIESDIQIEAETEALALHLTSSGRSNTEESRAVWNDGDVSATLSNFNFASDGWQQDEQGNTVLRVAGDGRVTIPYPLFGSDFRSTGKTIELEFATRSVMDYDAVIVSCVSGGRGLTMTAQKVLLKSEQSEISMQFKENEHVRVSFVIEKRTEHRLILCYINGIMSGAIQYPVNDDFAQTSPVGISIGSNDCTIDLYNIRVYDNSLTRSQILDNWIAGTQDLDELISRYQRNQVYDAYGKIVVENLPADLPYFILNAPELPQYKGDKKTITGSYVDRIYPSKSFTFTGCQINVQGTSSAPYYRKNYDLQFKNGFELASTHADMYVLREGVIPFNRFVLKADVASSEGANNVELVRIYNDSCPYKTPEMVEDPRVRWGIDGFPIAVFWNNTDTGEVSFLGKYNFNLPKRAPAPYGYANDDTMESWEFQNNTSALMLFLTDDFDESLYTDPDTGDTKELWRYDYEARFPGDDWTDYSILQEFQSFIYSTYREEASGDALDEPVIYEEVEYTNDTAAYRLAKFRAEFPTYAELSSFLFYYIFTELFLMVDSRAKNLFIGFNGSDVTTPGRIATRKATAQPYDMDTAIGTNNEGSLVFGYSLEDTDHLESGANVFNGQDSVLWNNLRDAFGTEIRQMYQSLRSNGVLSYDTIEERFEAHQNKWPEAVWIEDAWFKYLVPLVDPDAGKEPTGVYLPMLQGSKEQQRKWWLWNRFKYMDSKWNAGDALSQVVQLRGYAKADITVTPYADIYPTVKYASYVVQERGTHGQPTTLPCPLTTVNDTEIYIYSAPQIASLGDLSGLQVGFADFSRATRLQSLKIGDSGSQYSNGNLTELYLGNNELLRFIDVRNCPNLTQAVDISGCANIEHIYFDGTAITGLGLPKGGILKTLHLPGTLANLSIIGHAGITDFVLPDVSNLSTCRLENVGNAINTKAMVNSLPAGCRVRIIGFDWTVSNETELTALKTRLDTMRGINETGGNEDMAQMLGTIHIATVTGATLKLFKDNYPDITISYTNITSKCYFMNYNGTSVLKTVSVTNGGNASYTGNTPTKPSSVSEVYTFGGGWSFEIDGEADRNALRNILEDRYVYPVFVASVRTYTVKYYVGTRVIQTINDVPYGGSVYYSGETPTNTAETDPSDYEFTGWDPLAENIQGNVNCYAQFRYVGMVYKHLLSGTLKGEYQNTSATKIGVYGFARMSSLTKAEFTEVETVASSGLSNCGNLTEVSLPKARTLGYGVFSGDSKLASVNLPEATSVGDSCFQSCSMLTELNLPRLETCGANAFCYCSKLENIHMPQLKTIGSNAFQYDQMLKKIILPEGLTKIGEKAFYYCTKIQYLLIPSTINRIDSSAFQQNIALKEVIILGNPTGYFSNLAFTNCTNLLDIYVAWNYGEVRNAPWGATNAAIHYASENWMDDLEEILAGWEVS